MCSVPKVKNSTSTSTTTTQAAAPTPAPAPAAEAPVSPALNEEGASRTEAAKTNAAKKKGARGLRIDLQIGGTDGSTGGAGLNIPKV